MIIDPEGIAVLQDTLKAIEAGRPFAYFFDELAPRLRATIERQHGIMFEVEQFMAMVEKEQQKESGKVAH